MKKGFLTLLMIIFLLNIDAQQSKNGSMLIIGGHSKDKLFLKHFADLIGSKDSLIVVIPTGRPAHVLARDSGFVNLKSRFYNFGFSNVSVLHTLDKKVANSDSTVENLKRAKGVYLVGAGGTGGLIKAYHGTKVQQEIRNVYNRGGVIAGSSAGAMIFGEYIGERTKSDDSFTTFGYTGDLDTSLNFLPGTVFEVHLFDDNRQDNLSKVIKHNPDLLGIGIDWQTGIIVKNDILEVVGLHYAAIYDSSYHDKYFVLQKGDRYHLKERRLMKPNEGRGEIKLLESELKEYVGSYTENSGAILSFSIKDGKLYVGENISVQGIEVFAEKKDFLFIKIVNKQMVFKRNDNDKIIGFTIEPDGDFFRLIE